jgi:hypothetical protein
VKGHDEVGLDAAAITLASAIRTRFTKGDADPHNFKAHGLAFRAIPYSSLESKAVQFNRFGVAVGTIGETQSVQTGTPLALAISGVALRPNRTPPCPGFGAFGSSLISIILAT